MIDIKMFSYVVKIPPKLFEKTDCCKYQGYLFSAVCKYHVYYQFLSSEFMLNTLNRVPVQFTKIFLVTLQFATTTWAEQVANEPRND